MSDDVYENFQCDNSFWKINHTNPFYADGGNVLLGISRIISFILFFFLNWYNRILLSKKADDNVNIIKGLVLPSYFGYIYAYIILSLATGIIDIIIEVASSKPNQFDVWLVPIEIGIFHWLYEGLAFFLMRYGAGVKAIRRALSFSLVWGIVTAILYFFLISTLTGDYDVNSSEKTAYAIFLAYISALLLFYATFVIVPTKMLYRRPALDFYAKFNVVYCILCITTGSLLYNHNTDAVCPCSILVFIFVAFLQPMVIFRTLQIDSQYWQGLNPGQDNPLIGVWDHVGLDTAKSMAENLESFDRNPIGLPILHFGLIDFDKGGNFVAGGFSRVYFGRLKNEKVAFKILFAMELTPHDVHEFYREATVLHHLKHENVVCCKGVCVMPPTLTLVLDFCKYGSLFDFLYKPRKMEREDYFSIESTRPIMQLRQSNINRLTEVLPRFPAAYQHESTPILNPVQRIQPMSTTAPDEDSKSGDSFRDSKLSATSDGPKVRMSAFSMHSGKNSVASDAEKADESTERLSVASHISKAFGDFATMIGGSFFPNQAAAAASPLQPIAQYLTFEQRLRMMRDAACAITFLHAKGYIHCDIKSLNFLVTEDLRVKLADMGEARLITTPPKRDIPPIPARNWAPPEVLLPGAKPESYTLKSDIFGLCLVLSELILLELPFGDACERMSVQKWYNVLTVENTRPVLPDNLPSRLKRIIEQGWLSSAGLRPSAEEIFDAINEIIVLEDARKKNNSFDLESPP